MRKALNEKRQIIFKFSTLLILTVLLCVTAVCGLYDYLIPNDIVLFTGDSITTVVNVPFVTFSKTEKTADTDNYDSNVKIFGTIPLKNVSVNTIERIKLYPGGMPFGVKFYTQGVLVVGLNEIESEKGMSNPAYDAGLRVKDVITHINGTEVNTVEEVTKFVEASQGESIKITILRNNKATDIEVKPLYSAVDNTYKAGMWIRDSTAGIGTVTFINPDNNMFAGLGHGICDVDTAELMPMLKGQIIDVTISAVNKGKPGYPGELQGYFNPEKIGSLIGNTDTGVYGIYSKIPDNIPTEPLPIGLRQEVEEGRAYIYCTTDSNEVEKYEIEIIKINQNSSDLKNFIIKITDPKLLEATGGIVQGMSGSPVVQNDKIIGAVTHVLINDPTKGYGIFIESMLKNMVDILNVA